MKVEKPTKRQQLGESSRNEILDAATSLLAERGYAGMSVSALSKASGAAASSIYWHFGSKDGVLAAVVERRIMQFFMRHPDSRLTPGKPVERLSTMIEGSAEAFESEPDPLRLLLLLTLESHEGLERSTEAVSRLRARAAERWADAIHDVTGSKTTSQGIPVADLAVFCRAVADGALVAGLADDGVRTRDIYRTLNQVLLALIGSSGPDQAPAS
jgi:AcrR family transcriptional regulator